MLFVTGLQLVRDQHARGVTQQAAGLRADHPGEQRLAHLRAITKGGDMVRYVQAREWLITTGRREDCSDCKAAL